MLVEQFRRVFALGCDPALGSLTLSALFYILLLAGCAATPTITPTVRAQPGLPRPDRVLVNDFETANADS